MIETNIEHRLEPFRVLAASAIDTPCDPLPEALTDMLRLLVDPATHPTRPAPPIASGEIYAAGFRFEEIVGRGGMGTVYRAWDESLKRYVAVKILGFVAEPKQFEEFQREAQAAATIRSDYVVPIYSTGLTFDRRPYLVMPLIRGQTLRDRLQAGPILAKEVAKILREVAEGTLALHNAGLLHRDIKPANILLDDDDHRAKLTDFGLARSQVSTGLTLDGLFAGTPEYERLLEIESSDDRLHRAAITTAHQLGLLQSNLGRFDAAEATLRRSIEFARAVVAQNPNDAEAKQLLLLSLNTLHVVFGKAHQLERASEIDFESIAICQELLNLKPDDLTLRRNLASLKANRASGAIVRGDPASARTFLLEAHQHFEELIRFEPDDLTLQIDITRIDFNLGFVAETTAERVRCYKLALVARRKIISLEPRRPYFVNEYVKNCLYLALELSRTDDQPSAVDQASEGILVARQQLKLATDATLQLLLCDLLGITAICSSKLNKVGEADAAYREAMEIYQSLGTTDGSRYQGSALDLAIQFLTFYKDQKRLHTAEAQAVRRTANAWLDAARMRSATGQERIRTEKWQERLDAEKSEK